MSACARSPAHRRKGYFAALLVGAAFTGIGTAPATAAPAISPTAVESVSRYCTACWRNARLQPDAWPDCTQEVLCRLLERLEPAGWPRVLSPETPERREFLRAIDTVKKRTQRAHRTTSLSGEVADSHWTHRQFVAEQRKNVLQLAKEHLSPRQERIVVLCLDGWSIGEIAEKLELPAARVSDEKYKASQRLRGLLVSTG